MDNIPNTQAFHDWRFQQLLRNFLADNAIEGDVNNLAENAMEIAQLAFDENISPKQAAELLELDSNDPTEKVYVDVAEAILYDWLYIKRDIEG